MSVPNSVYDLYRDRVVLWVEDELTREALTMLWGPTPGVAVAIAGSKDGVRALVNGAPAHRAGRIVGLVDRDFDRPKAGGVIVQTERHEFENELLDFEVLASLTPSKAPAEEIEALAKTHAEGLLPWVACKATLQVAKEAVRAEFPADPSTTLASLDAAADFITGSVEWRLAPAAWGEWSTRPRIERELADWAETFRASLTTRAWCDEFPGKEVFRHLRGHARLRLPGSAGAASPAQKDLDLAKRVVRAMVDRGRVPRAVSALRERLCAGSSQG